MLTAKRTITKIRTSPRAAVRRVEDAADGGGRTVHAPLHWMAAGLFVATGAEALASRRVLAETDGQRRRPWRLLGLTPLVVAPLAGVVHAANAARPVPRTRKWARVLDGAAVGAAAVATMAGAIAAARNGRDARWYRRGRNARISLLEAVTPLAFGATGALGLVLEREERAEAEARQRLERRARLLDRLAPRRRARVDRIVIHV
ncbi:MAG TPA: hypothetical protein VF158_13755 [Longimicrobiales bacterium]